MSDIPQELYAQLYNKLATSLSLPGTVGSDTSAILSLQVPGLYIRPHLDMHDPETQYYIANALDGIGAFGWSFVRKPGSVSDVYRSILDGKETPIVELSPEQRAALDRAQALLEQPDGEPTTTYASYLACQLDYLEALDDLEAARSTFVNGGPPVPAALEARLAAREAVWRIEGRKSEVENAIATVRQYESLEPARFWARLSERFAAHTRRVGLGNEFQYVTSNPPYEHWFQEFGWSDFSFDETDFRSQPPTGGAGAGDDGACCCAGPSPLRSAFSFSPVGSPPGDARQDRQGASFGARARRFRMTCRLRRIEIVRPWMDANVFFSRAWRWSPASVSYGVELSSGGNVAARVAPRGVMPVLPTTAILARDVEIDWEDGGETRTQAQSLLDQGRELHFGPFRLTRAAWAGDHHISMPDPQLVGFITTILPRCPNPDATLNWPLTARSAEHWF